MHKSQLHIHTLIMTNLKERKKTIPFIKTSKRMKYLGINLTKAKNLYTRNCKHCQNKLQMTKINGKTSSVPGLKCQYYPRKI